MRQLLAFSEPWHACDDQEFAAELRREVCERHVLYGVEVRVIASRQDQDDFLFELPDGRFALVHLTWKQEWDPGWPFTYIYSSAEEAQAAIRQDVDEWQSFDST